MELEKSNKKLCSLNVTAILFKVEQKSLNNKLRPQSVTALKVEWEYSYKKFRCLIVIAAIFKVDLELQPRRCTV